MYRRSSKKLLQRQTRASELVRLVLIFAVVIGLTAFIDTRAHADGGSAQFKTVDTYLIHDQKQKGKEIPVRIVFPPTAGKYPVIVFSHGAGGSKDNYSDLTDFWAGQGFICVQPTHDDSAGILRKKFGTVSRESAIETTSDPVYWVSRVRDMEAVIDALPAVQQQLPKDVLIDYANIGVGGHSFGSFTAQVLGGATPFIPPGVVSGVSGRTNFSDKRIKAVLLLSPQGVVSGTGLGLPDNRAWSQMAVPLMLMTGSRDRGQRGETPDWREQPYFNAPAGDKYLVFIEGAEHMTFAGSRHSDGQLRARFAQALLARREQNANLPQLFPYVKAGSLTFWNAYLKHDNQSKQKLLSHEIAAGSGGLV